MSDQTYCTKTQVEFSVNFTSKFSNRIAKNGFYFIVSVQNKQVYVYTYIKKINFFFFFWVFQIGFNTKLIKIM